MKRKILLAALMPITCMAMVAGLWINNIITSSMNRTVEAIQYPFELVMTLGKTTYSLGEPVNITLSLTNISDENVKISLLAGGTLNPNSTS